MTPDAETLAAKAWETCKHYRSSICIPCLASALRSAMADARAQAFEEAAQDAERNCSACGAGVNIAKGIRALASRRDEGGEKP